MSRAKVAEERKREEVEKHAEKYLKNRNATL